MKLTPKQSAMAPRALAFIRDDFERQDAAEVRHWGKHLHGGVGVSNVAVSEHLGMGKKDTLSLLDKLVGAGLLAQVSEYTGTAEQRRGWAGGGARNFHKEHWNYDAVTYTVRSYRVTPLGAEWLAAQVRSNPAKLSDADERELDHLVGRITDNIYQTLTGNPNAWEDAELAVAMHEDYAAESWREQGCSTPFSRVWPKIYAQAVREAKATAPWPNAIDEGPWPGLQTLLFDRQHWTTRDAQNWLRRHQFTGLVPDEKPNTIRFRQVDPGEFYKDSFRTITLSEERGLKAVVGDRRAAAGAAAPRPRRKNPEEKLTEAQERALLSLPERAHSYAELPRRTGLALCRAGLAEAKSFGYATLDQPVGAERFERTQRRTLEFTLTDKGRAYRAALKGRA